MSWLSRRDTTKPDYTALQLNTSVPTVPIPIVYGRNKIAPNLIWYARFVAVPGGGGPKGTGGKGGGSGGQNGATEYTYEADIILALCEGPITDWIQVWKDQSAYPIAYLGFSTYNGVTPAPVWPWLTTFYPWQALSYQGTAYVAAPGYNLGSSATIGNHNFEIDGVLAGTGANGVDADPAQVIYDFLTNAQYGAGFNSASINSAALFGSGGDPSLQTYCLAMGLCFSPVISSQESASSILTRWLQILNCAAVWSGGELKFIPYADEEILSGSATTYQFQFAIPTPIPVASGVGLPASVTVTGVSSFSSDGGVVYAASGIPLTYIGATLPSVAGTYGVTPAGTYWFAVGDEGIDVSITFTATSPTTYTPNVAPVYSLTDLDFVDEKGNKDPLQVERVDIFSLPTIQRVEVSSRGNRFSPVPVEARDQSQIEIFGPRVGPVVQAHEITDEFLVAQLVAQTILQRELYVRTKFTFKLSWEYCLLDPMDVVAITDENLGLSSYPVRIISIEEDDNGLVTILAEELVQGISTPQFYQGASATGTLNNQGVPAVTINSPLIYEPPTALTNGVPQIWVGASGINGESGGNGQWGGANVWISVDNASYSQVAQITQYCRQGVLTANTPAASGWDTTNSFAVNFTESFVPPPSATTLDSAASVLAAQQGATLSLVDQELISYETGTLTSTANYTLTNIERGMGGTTGAAHSIGAPFCRLDGAIAKYDLPSSLIGIELYFKFQSFNIFGLGLQDLSTCAVYTYTPAGVGVAHPIAAQLQSGVSINLGLVTSSVTVSDDFGQVVSDPVIDIIDLGTAP